MRYFPIFMDLKERDVFVIGGGESAAQKLRLLLRVEDIRITVISPTLCPSVRDIFFEWNNRENLSHLAQEFNEKKFLSYIGRRLPALLYSTDASLHARVSSVGRKWNIPVNAVDTPSYCDFITPALVDRTPVVVAIGTEGYAPILAQEIRGDLEHRLNKRLGMLARCAGDLRKKAANIFKSDSKRRHFWRYFFTDQPAHYFFKNNMPAFYESVATALQDSNTPFDRQKRTLILLSLPPQADLLSMRGYRFLQDADILLYEPRHKQGVNEVLEYVRRDSERIGLADTYCFSTEKMRHTYLINQIAKYVQYGKRTLYLHRHDDHFIEALGAIWRRRGIEIEIIGENNPPSPPSPPSPSHALLPYELAKTPHFPLKKEISL